MVQSVQISSVIQRLYGIIYVLRLCVSVRFNEYNGRMLQELITLRHKSYEAFCSLLKQDNIPVKEILKLSCAIMQDFPAPLCNMR